MVRHMSSKPCNSLKYCFGRIVPFSKDFENFEIDTECVFCLFQDVTFHQAVNLGRYEQEKVVSFVPPDGEFELMKYRCQDGIQSPFSVLPVIAEQGRTRVEVRVVQSCHWLTRRDRPPPSMQEAPALHDSALLCTATCAHQGRTLDTFSVSYGRLQLGLETTCCGADHAAHQQHLQRQAVGAEHGRHDPGARQHLLSRHTGASTPCPVTASVIKRTTSPAAHHATVAACPYITS